MGPILGLFDNSIKQEMGPLGILETPVAKNFQVANMSFEPPSHPDSAFELHFFADCVLC